MLIDSATGVRPPGKDPAPTALTSDRDVIRAFADRLIAGLSQKSTSQLRLLPDEASLEIADDCERFDCRRIIVKLPDGGVRVLIIAHSSTSLTHGVRWARGFCKDCDGRIRELDEDQIRLEAKVRVWHPERC